MSSTFYGLEIARSALVANQVALEVTGQNASNVNTEDYTRQRADMVAIYNSGGNKFASNYTSSPGQGVSVAKISQIRDEYLDIRVRNANSQYSTAETTYAALTDIEDVLDESDADGLHAMLNDFYKQLDKLSQNAGNVEYSSLVRSSAEKVVQVFNQYALQLEGLREEQDAALVLAVDEVNSTIDKINEVNLLIKNETIHGDVSNGLLDMRNSYLDTLSGYLNISVAAQEDGTVSVTSAGGIDVLSSKFSLTKSGDEVVLQRTDGNNVTQEFCPTSGSVKGYLDVLNGAGNYAETDGNTFRGLAYYEKALDNLANAFAGTFNSLNTLDASSPANLFTGATAAEITVSEAWYGNANYIVVADQGTNDNIQKMVNAMEEDVNGSLYPGVDGTFEGYSRILMSNILVDVGYYKDIAKSNKDTVDTLVNERDSIMGVSTDEETINMTKYQRAYQAAARLMTVMDENLNTLINSMGVVGR